MWIDNSEDLLKIFDRVQDYDNYLVDLEENHTCKTLDRIRSYHKFTFSKSGKIKCFDTSDDTEYSDKVDPNDL
jgi:hypothetical protein